MLKNQFSKKNTGKWVKILFLAIFEFLVSKGHFGPFSAISADKPDLSKFLVKCREKKIYCTMVLRICSFSILKIKHWQNFSCERYLRFIFCCSEKRSCFSHVNPIFSKVFKILLLTLLKTFYVKYSIFTFFELNLS